MLAPSFRYNAGLIRANGTPFFTGDGSTSSAQLVDRHGNPISSAKLKRVDAIHRTDWQGRQLLYPTARTNLQKKGQCDTGFVAYGTTPPTVASSVSFDGQSCTQVDFPANSDTAFAGCRAYRNSGADYLASVVSGDTYIPSAFIGLDRALTGTEAIVFYMTGVWGTPSFVLNAANSASFVGKLSRTANSPGASVSTGTICPTLFVSGKLQTALTAYICCCQLEQANITGAYIATPSGPVTVTDYTLSGSTVNFGETPIAGATCDWTGVARR